MFATVTLVAPFMVQYKLWHHISSTVHKISPIICIIVLRNPPSPPKLPSASGKPSVSDLCECRSLHSLQGASFVICCVILWRGGSFRLLCWPQSSDVLIHASWVLANIMTESWAPLASRKCDRNNYSGSCQFCTMFCPDFGWIIENLYPVALGLGSWWSQWVQTSWQLVTAIDDEKGDGLISKTCCEDFSALHRCIFEVVVLTVNVVSMSCLIWNMVPNLQELLIPEDSFFFPSKEIL